MPLLNSVARGSDAVFLAVDLQEDGAKARSFFDQLALDRLDPILDLDGQTTRRYGVLTGLPQTFFIDAQGRVVASFAGPLDPTTLDHYLALIAP